MARPGVARVTLLLKIRPRDVGGARFEETECGRAGCFAWIGTIGAVVPEANPNGNRGEGFREGFEAKRVHLLERNWKVVAIRPAIVWAMTRRRHRNQKPRTLAPGLKYQPEEWVNAVAPDVVLLCPKCKSPQTLPPGSSAALPGGPPAAKFEIAVSRLRPLD